MPKHMDGYLHTHHTHTPENAHTHVLVHGISGPAEREGKEVVRRTWWEHSGNTGHDYFKSVTPATTVKFSVASALGRSRLHYQTDPIPSRAKGARRGGELMGTPHRRKPLLYLCLNSGESELVPSRVQLLC